MKAIVPEIKQFKPVHLVLETQEEVDKMFAILNCPKVTRPLEVSDWYQDLQCHQSRASDEFFRKLDQALK